MRIRMLLFISFNLFYPRYPFSYSIQFSCSSTERIETIAMQCTFVMPIPREKNLRSVIVFSNVFENFLSQNNSLCDLSKVCQLRSRRFPKPQITTVFRRAQNDTSKISRKSTENSMTKRMGFHIKRSEVCEVYRFR